MIYKRLCMVLAIMLFAVIPLIAHADTSYNGYIVELTDAATELLSSSGDITLFGNTALNEPDEIYAPKNLYRIENEETLNQYIEAGLVKNYEKDPVVQLFRTPSEPYYNTSYQSYLWQTGTADAWSMGCYGNGVKIGIIDSGVYPHKDFYRTVGTDAETGEPIQDYAIKGGINCTDDGNEESNFGDTLGHGTFVAGIIASQFNSYGFAGMTPMADIYVLKAFVGQTTSLSYILKCIYAAVDTFECDIINMSFGVENSKTNTNFKEAIDYAYSKNVIICAATGNNPSGTTGTADSVMYPAGYDNVIGVGSVDRYNKHSLFSHENNSVYVTAPGSSMHGLGHNGGTTVSEGTSFSCPQVSSAAAIAKNIDPDITPDEFMELIRSTSIDLGTEGYDTTYGWGLLNISGIVLELLHNESKTNKYFVSPITRWSNTDISCTVYNNTFSDAEMYTLLKGSNVRNYDIISLEMMESAEVMFEDIPTDSVFYTISRDNLRPCSNSKR